VIRCPRCSLEVRAIRSRIANGGVIYECPECQHIYVEPSPDEARRFTELRQATAVLADAIERHAEAMARWREGQPCSRALAVGGWAG
jgi:hypothetical protein